MLQPRRLPASILRIWTSTTRLKQPQLPLCIRHDSRWTPGHPRPRQKIPKEYDEVLVPEDPKDNIPGWKEFKEDLISKVRKPDEIAAINELSPQEAMFLMDPDSYQEMDADDEAGMRTIPANKNYFSAHPVVEQRLQDVEKMMEKYGHLPKAPPAAWPLREWKRAAIARPRDLDMRAGQYDPKGLRGSIRRTILQIGKELNKIHPVLMPQELKVWLDDFAPLRQEGTAGVRQKRVLDRFQRSKGNGKRKTARAKVQVVPGDGQVFVNGVPAADFFKRTKDVENVIWPLQSLNVLAQYNVWVSTWGGGTTGSLSVEPGC